MLPRSTRTVADVSDCDLMEDSTKQEMSRISQICTKKLRLLENVETVRNKLEYEGRVNFAAYCRRAAPPRARPRGSAPR